MYYPNAIEEICFDQSHIEKVLAEMKPLIKTYFNKYIETEGGHVANNSQLEMLALKFGATSKPNAKRKDYKKILERLLIEGSTAFQNERQDYLEILDLKSLEEYGADVSSFKNTTLKNQIPIIRKTLNNVSAKELDKFRTSFGISNASEVFKVTSNIVELANELHDNWYDPLIFENIQSLDELRYQEFDTEEYTVYGVIGGGIKSHFVYKLFPQMFPNRSRESVWALYYLSDRKKFDCKQDSEFLMIDAKEGTTQQNYFYPYKLFSYYALRIYLMLKELYSEQGITLSADYRFVAVDNFLSFVSRSHQDEINSLKQKSNITYQYEY